MDFMVWVCLTGWVLTLLVLIGVNRYSKRLEREIKNVRNELQTIHHSITTTQARLRVRRRGDEVQPIIQRPKVEQPYEGRGVPAEREAPAARIGTTKRYWAGGKERDPRRGGYVEGDGANRPSDGPTEG